MPQPSAPFPWPGSKSQLADWILSSFPHHRQYVDLFGGSGALLFEKSPSETERYNDADADLVQFMTVLRDSPDELVERLQAIPYARELHQDWTTAFFEGHRPSDSIERAARYYFIQRAQYGGEAAKKTGFRATVDGRRNPARQWRNSITRLPEFAERLQNVQLSCCDYTEVLAALAGADQSTLIYADPPYRDSSERYRLDGNDASSPGRNPLPSFDFDEFATRLKEFSEDNPEVQILVSSDVIPDSLADFHRDSKEDSFSMNAANGVKGTTEFLLSNYDPATSPSHSQNTTLGVF